MLISGTETAHTAAPTHSVAATHAPTAPSAAITEDDQSVRQMNLNATTHTAASEAPTMSFRNVGPMDRATVSSQRRGNLVLFVKSNENESDAPPRGMNNASMAAQPHANNNNGSNNSSVASQGGEHAKGGEEGSEEDMLSTVISALSSGGSSVLGAVTGAARKPLLTAGIVLLYFILLDILLLQDNERLNRILRRVRATDNDALVLLSSSLVRQMQEAKKDLYDTLALRDPPATLERLEMMQHKVLALERVCNRSLARLHLQLMFPGTVDDLTFLVTEHVTYDAQLQHLAAEELAWMRTVMSSSVVHMSEEVPEGQRFVLGSHAAAFGSAAEDGSAGVSAHLRDSPEVFESEEEAAAAEEELNPLRNVRLERVKKSGKASGGGGGVGSSSSVSAQSRSRFVRAAAAAKRRRLRQKGIAVPLEEEVEEEVAVAASGILSLLKNRYIAFVIICFLLAGVLRMG